MKPQTDNFLYRFPWRKSSLELFFPIALSCQTPVLFAELFFTSQPNSAGIERQMSWQILALLSSPPTCTSKVFSSRNVTEEILFHVYSYIWPTRNSWTSVAPLGTGGYWAALQSAVNPPGCHWYTVTSPSPWFRKLMQYIVLQWTFRELCFQSCTLETAGRLPYGCRDIHSRSFWVSKWCFGLAKSTLSLSLSPVNQRTLLRIIQPGCHGSLTAVTGCCNSDLFSILNKRECWCFQWLGPRTDREASSVRVETSVQKKGLLRWEDEGQGQICQLSAARWGCGHC